MVRRGLAAPLETRLVNGFYTAVVPPDSPKVGDEDVKRLLEDEF